MKLITALTLSILFISCKSSQLSRTIKFNITTTSDYCGGAMPDDEVLESINNPSPFNGKVFLHVNPERKDKGIEIELKKGKSSITGMVNSDYAIFIYPAMDSTIIKNKNSYEDPILACEILKSMEPIEFISVKSDTKEVSLNLHIRCDPCQQPMP